MKLLGSQRKEKGGFSRTLKEQRAKLYIIRRCIVLLLTEGEGSYELGLTTMASKAAAFLTFAVLLLVAGVFAAGAAARQVPFASPAAPEEKSNVTTTTTGR
uniref:Uncharacterized protein n=1 Tax=Ananas comosus var. bracteatus TaxID=296719 RepID=A0A6V7PVP9_ANACO|nr:unnamed protein product [Ananas comosus var. bracteatus]